MQKSDFDYPYPAKTGFFYLLWILFLLLAPLFCAGYLSRHLTWFGKDVGSVFAFGIFLPASYLIIYLALRKLNAESRSFIFFVVLFFLVGAGVEIWKALKIGELVHWAGAGVAFAYLAIYGLVYSRINRSPSTDAKN
ncbi:hypothetical protein [Achromobacter spanius]|uniref:hypothetical protein n=1 Tax=Achromobacter spanius TaxID=217203 RepID=UPI003A8DE691